MLTPKGRLVGGCVGSENPTALGGLAGWFNRAGGAGGEQWGWLWYLHENTFMYYLHIYVYLYTNTSVGYATHFNQEHIVPYTCAGDITLVNAATAHLGRGPLCTHTQ